MSRFRVILNATPTVSAERLYDIVRSPVITEKATMGSEHNQVTFRVPLDATKREVKVGAVNTLRTLGKTKRFRGKLGKRVDGKKAMVTLVEGSRIDVTTGI